MRARFVHVAPRSAIRAALPLAVLAAAVLLTSPGADAASKKARRAVRTGDPSGPVYRWVDDQGVVHFGDQVPPEYAPLDREVLNQYGIAVRTEQGQLTPEEIEAERKAAADKKAAEATERRDAVLLSTYLSVEEIEALRDRRMELIDGQIAATAAYLESLRGRLGKLQTEAARFKPYNTDPEAETIDGKLARELADTADSVALYQKTLNDTRTRQGRVVLAFDADIARFKELKGL